MRKFLACGLSLALAAGALAQSQPPPPTLQDEEIIRITTQLVQVDAVVLDKNDQPITDLKLDDFEIYDNGRKQELQFMEFVSIDAPRRTEGTLRSASISPADAAVADAAAPRELTARDIKRVVAFVVDDVTIPSGDLYNVRKMLTDFVDNRMGEGDLVAIVRTVGGHGLLEQYTNDKQILRRAIAQLGVRTIPPYLAFGGPDTGRISGVPQPAMDVSNANADPSVGQSLESSLDFEGPNEGAKQIPRGVLALSVANQVVDSLREIPGRKSLVLLSGGLPLFDLTRSGAIISDLSRIFNILSDNALRSGVVINTMDVRGLQVQGAVANFVDTPAKSSLGGGTLAGSDTNTAGRLDPYLLGERSLSEQLTLSNLAATTGGVSVINSNNFNTGLDRVLNRSRAYYRLAYRPSGSFDNKFHKLDIKVRRGGAKVYRAEGYFAREDKANKPRTKDEEILGAAKSPLARRDIEVASNLQYKFTPAGGVALDIQTLISARELKFERTPEGKYRTSLEVAGFILDPAGKSIGGISQTVNAELTEESHRRALAHGIGYTASTQLTPGYYQVRLVVREAATGNLGTVSRYFEVPDLSNKALTMSSLVLYEANPQDAKAQPLSLDEARAISRKNDLRYAATIHNAKAEGGRHQLRTQMIVSQNGKVLFREPEQPVPAQGAQVVKVGQLVLARVQPGRYTLTLVVTDPLADKKRQSVARSVDFTVIN